MNPRRWKASSRHLVTLLSVTVLVAATFAPATAAAQETAQPDGASSHTAAASCWEIKQNYPSAANGVYWLVTPKLQAPEQFYCDMTTAGGGWVLVGRGREGWRTNYEGRGTAAQVRGTVDGTAAFDVRQLPSQTIDGLLNGGRVDALTDGIRLRRATAADGSAWQEARFKMQSRDRWVWTFPAEHRVGSFSFGTTTGSGGQTNNFGTDNSFNRVNTTATSAQAWTHGWAFGSNVTGTNSSTTYLWSNTNGAGFARPFTQVYLRPQLRLSDLSFPSIADSGAPKQELQPLLANGVLPGDWGVTGLANGTSSELAPEVSAFAQIGNRVFVGGNFRYVQRGQNPSASDRVEQSYLAAFDVNTGNWLSDFRPRLNQQVKSLAALPNGTLVAGGEFTQANGQTAVGAVRLDPATGATASGWGLQLENRLGGGGSVNVRALEAHGDWLYLGGLFTHVTGGNSSPVYGRMAARVSASTGTPDPNWNPEFDGSVIDMDASADGTRLYASGHFSTSKGQSAKNVAALNTTNAALVQPAWSPVWSANKSYQQAIMEVGNRVWSGGSEHNLFSFDRSTFERLSGNITKQGGDFQAVEAARGVVYASCHCDQWNYSNAYTWSNVGTNWTQADKIGYTGAWDAATGNVLPEFNPVMRVRAGYGPWAIFADSTGNVWMGGDLTGVVRANGSVQWVGGFARFGHRDSTAPSTPSNLRQTALDEQSLTLAWNGSTDGGGAVTYEVFRENRVVATTNQTSMTLPAPTDSTRYFVRARDVTGNRSATTTALTVTPAPPDSTVSLVSAGSTWRWRYVNEPWPDGWTTVGFDDSGWAQGPAVLGFGSSGLGTNIDVSGSTSTRPLSAWFRQRFTVEDVSQMSAATVTTLANDGVVVFVNGTEVGRANLPTGTLTSSTWATAAPSAATAAANPVTFSVPSSLLRDGTNVVAASTHLNYRGTPDISFDLSMVGLLGSDDADPPPAPTVSATLSSGDTAELAWTHASSSDVIGYEVARDGASLAWVPAPTASYTDSGLAPSTSYEYGVVAVDGVGNRSPPGRASVETPAAEPQPEELVAAGSTWRWRYVSEPWPAGWTEVGFDDSGWAQGPAVLGFGSSGLETDIDVSGSTSTRPLSAWFRRSFTVEDASAWSGATVATRADDGVVVFVNGTEVGRANLPSGSLTSSTWATAAPRTSTAVANPVTFAVPASLLQDGANVVAASTHLNYRGTPDISFDLRLVANP